MLAMTDYSDRLYPNGEYTPPRNILLDKVDNIFTAIFIAECALKIMAYGFVLKKNSYLRDAWNWLDFFVVIVSIISILPLGLNTKSLKSMRTFRVLRPLRSINSLPRLRALIQSLLLSIPGLVNVLAFLVFIFAIFAIFGLHEYSGVAYTRCRIGEGPVDGVWPIDDSVHWLCQTDDFCAYYTTEKNASDVHCGSYSSAGFPNIDPRIADDVNNDEVINYDILGFDNFGQALLTVFQALTLQAWAREMMYIYTDGTDAYTTSIYFIIMVVLGAFFAMNLVLAQIIDSF